jgi:hypothetical protein
MKDDYLEGVISNIKADVSYGLAAKATYPCSYEWGGVGSIPSIPGPTHEACLRSVSEMERSPLKADEYLNIRSSKEFVFNTYF